MIGLLDRRARACSWRSEDWDFCWRSSRSEVLIDERERVVRCERYADVTLALFSFSGSADVSESLSAFLDWTVFMGVDDDDDDDGCCCCCCCCGTAGLESGKRISWSASVMFACCSACLLVIRSYNCHNVYLIHELLDLVS